MADFKAALKIGISEALKVERQREEIKEIINELSTQILEATNGKVTIAIEAAGLSSIASSYLQKKALIPQELVASAVDKNNRKRTLSSWQQSSDGYPCRITINNIEYSCEDKYALEECLTRLLQDFSAGEKIHALMQEGEF